VVEVSAGVMLAAGLLTPLAAAGVIGILSVAIVLVHRKNGFFIIKEGWEYAGVIIAVCSAIGVLGPGRWSVDHAVFGWTDVHGWAGLGLSAGVGVAAAIGLLAVFWRPTKPAV
jgi:putative oxidoreductase